MTSNLFRKEVVDAQSQHDVSGTALVVPLSSTVFILVAFLFAVAVLAFLLFGQYSPKDTVRGYITTTKANVRVFASSAGVIEDIHVSDGDWVQAGQSLLRLSTSRRVSHSDETRKTVMAALRAEQELLSAEIENIKKSAAVKKAALQDELQALAARLVLLQKQETALSQAAKIAEREVDRFTQMRPSGFVSGKDMDRAQAALLEANLRISDLQIDYDDIRSTIRQTTAVLTEYPHQIAVRINTKEAEYQRLVARIAEGQAVSRQEIVAPSDGIVTGLLVRSGQTISADSPVLSLVPRNEVFYAVLLIPTRTIGFIKPGASVSIRYDAFPYQKFGLHDGIVDQVARTTTLPGDKSFPLRIQEAVYLTRVTLLQQEILAYAERRPLQPGMTLTADIQREKRRIVEWVFDPLISAKQRL